MDWVFAIAVYFVVWWIGLFAILPFFARPQNESDGVVMGTPESAPTQFPLWKFALVNTVWATFIFAIVWSLIIFDPFEIGQPPETGVGQ